MKTLLPVLTALLLTACQGTVPRDEASPWYHPSAGTTVTVHRAIDIPPGRARTFLQNGQIVAYTARNLYYPNCEFEVLTVDETVRRILPGEFRVQRVLIRQDQVAGGGPVRLADAGRHLGIGLGIGPWGGMGLAADDDGPSYIMYVVEMRLRSPEQPDVFRLVCRGGEDDPADAIPPSIREMRQALGDYATLTLPDAPAED